MQLLPMASSPDGLISARYAVIPKTPGWEALTTTSNVNVTGKGGGDAQSCNMVLCWTKMIDHPGTSLAWGAEQGPEACTINQNKTDLERTFHPNTENSGLMSGPTSPTSRGPGCRMWLSCRPRSWCRQRGLGFPI